MYRYKLSEVGIGGAKRDRTADLLHAMQALSQLSYGPNFRSAMREPRRMQTLRNDRFQDHKSWSGSSVLVVLAAAADDVRDIVPFVFVGLEEGIILCSVVCDFDLIVADVDVVARSLLPAL